MSSRCEAPAVHTVAHDWRLWTVEARLVVTDPAALDHAIDICHAITDEVDELASRFRSDSPWSVWAVSSPLLAPGPKVVGRCLSKTSPPTRPRSSP